MEVMDYPVGSGCWRVWLLLSPSEGWSVFDVTEWLKERRRQTEENLTLLCPHVTWEVDNSGTVQVRSAYVSPSGTMAWQCQLCGSITNDTGHPSRVAQYWANNPKALIKRHKKMSRLARKLGRG